MIAGRPPLPQLTGDVPDAPMVETQAYRFPAAGPDAPEADRCSDDQLLQLAVDAVESRGDLLALISSPQHVRRLCELLCRIEPVARRTREIDQELRVCRLALDEERNAHQVTILDREFVKDLHEAELAERIRLAGLHAELSALLVRRTKERDQAQTEAIHLRHQINGTTPAAIRIALDRAQRESHDETVIVDLPLPRPRAANGGARG